MVYPDWKNRHILDGKKSRVVILFTDYCEYSPYTEHAENLFYNVRANDFWCVQFVYTDYVHPMPLYFESTLIAFDSHLLFVVLLYFVHENIGSPCLCWMYPSSYHIPFETLVRVYTIAETMDVFPADSSNLSLFRTSVLQQTGGFFFITLAFQVTTHTIQHVKEWRKQNRRRDLSFRTQLYTGENFIRKLYSVGEKWWH